MSELTTERLEQFIANPLGNPLYRTEQMDMARQLLASLEAEPVGEFYHEKQGGWYQISEGDKVSDNRRIPLYAAPVLPKQPELPQGFTYESGILTANFGNGDVLISDTHWPESGHAGISFAPVPQPKRPNLSDYTDLLGGSKTEDVGTLFIVKSNSAESLIAIRNKLDIAINALSPAPAQPVIPEQRQRISDDDLVAVPRSVLACAGYAYRKAGMKDGKAYAQLKEYQFAPAINAQPVIPEQLEPTISFYRDGIIAAAKWVERQREAYDNEHGQHDSDTGSFEFGNDAQRDYSETLAEIAEGIRSLHPASALVPPLVSFDKLMDAVSEVTGVKREFDATPEKGYQAVPFMNFNSLSRIVEMFRSAQPVSEPFRQSLTDIRTLILSEVSDFFAGFGTPGEPEAPEEMQRQLTMRIGRILNNHIVSATMRQV
ncbi:hypothetical protein [Hafnia alvei]|uniref:hypothetical protein n=1 Tax=Hafnia alvei TaxID=569 RepID=UPI001E51BA3C|nr:hypothetical protein [Hafnia alvei]